MTREAASDIIVMPPDVLTDDDVPRLYGIDRISDGTFYVSDAWNRRVYHYGPTSAAFPQGELLDTFGAAQTGGDNRGVEVNEARNAVYVVDAEHSDVDVFGLDGTYRFSFGSEGNGPDSSPAVVASWRSMTRRTCGSPTSVVSRSRSSTGTARRCCAHRSRPRSRSQDSWASLVTLPSTTRPVMSGWPTRGTSGSSGSPRRALRSARGDSVDPGGAFNMNYPRTIAINPQNRQIWVANERGHHIQVYNYPTSQTASPTYVAQIGQIGNDDTDPGHFLWPVDVEFYQPPDREHARHHR